MEKIILVNPPLSFEERYGKLSAGGSHLAPIGLANLAAVIRENNFDPKIIDASTLNLNYEETVDRIMSYSPKYVGITAVTISIHSAAKIAKMLRERNKDIITIIGGPHLTSIPMKTIELFPEFDIGVIGEGEVTIIELLNAYENNMNIEKIPGLIIR